MISQLLLPSFFTFPYRVVRFLEIVFHLNISVTHILLILVPQLFAAHNAIITQVYGKVGIPSHEKKKKDTIFIELLIAAVIVSNAQELPYHITKHRNQRIILDQSEMPLTMKRNTKIAVKCYYNY